MKPPQSSQRAERPSLTTVLDECDQHARAVVRLNWRGTTIVGRGSSRLDAEDDVHQPIGQKLAVARALSDLVRQLFTDAAAEMDAASALSSA